MKNSLSLFIVFFFGFSLSVFSQERQDEASPELNLRIERKSEKITQIPGWSHVKTPKGKTWEQSDSSMGYNYLVGRPREFSFYSLHVIEFSINGKRFYALSIEKPRYKQEEDFNGTKWEYDSLMLAGRGVDWFFFTESSLKRLKNIVNAADGKPYRLVDVKYYKTGWKVKGGISQEIYIGDKEMKSILLTGNVSILKSTNLCQGDSLFIINSQVLKGDTIIRFNVLSDIAPKTATEFRLLPLDDSYFEITNREFNNLFRFSDFVSKEESKKAREYVNSGEAKDKLKDYAGAIADYSAAIELDPGYAEAYCARALSKIQTGDKESGCRDLKIATGLGYKPAYKKTKELCK